jgi:ribosomal protein L12E/L44/L45/RPP1/RPP2
MARSEIDDIFASKNKQKPASSSTHPQVSQDAAKKVLKQQKKNKKRKRESAQKDQPLDDTSEQNRPTKHRVPETVIDPSLVPAAPVKRTKSAPSANSQSAKKTKKKEDKEDEERFKDSRGTGPSTLLYLPHRYDAGS